MERINVLLVDDEEFLRGLIISILNDDGFFPLNKFNVFQVGNGNDAILKLESGEFSIVISDFRMPGAWGTEVVKKAKERFGDRVGIIFMTGEPKVILANGNSVGEEAIALGADLVLSKPFAMENLVDAVKALLKEGE